jgi:hypothetical protein|tara:strand:- start:1623 stop:1817 length:195 start_codon:yes stop_codon:yes gene_type:complete
MTDLFKLGADVLLKCDAECIYAFGEKRGTCETAKMLKSFLEEREILSGVVMISSCKECENKNES